MNAYRVLGIEPGASRDTVRKAYRALCLKYHPDKHNTNIPDATRHFIEVTEAYKKIMADMPASSAQPEPDTGPDITDLLIEVLSSYIRSMIIPTKPDPIIIPVTVTLSEIMNPVMRKCVVRVSRIIAGIEDTLTETVYICAGRYPTRRVYIFPGLGDETSALTAIRGDIEVHVSVDHIEPFRFDDNGDIVYDMPLSLSEYVDGCTKSIPGWVDAFEIPNLPERDMRGNVTEMPCGGATVLLSISKTLPI